MKLGSRVKAWREAQGWSLEKLGQKANVEKQIIWALENRDSGKSMHGPAIARAFGLTYEQLLDPTVHPTKVSGSSDGTLKTHTPTVDLSNDEAQLLQLWRQLGAHHKHKLLESLRALTSRIARDAELAPELDLTNDDQSRIKYSMHSKQA